VLLKLWQLKSISFNQPQKQKATTQQIKLRGVGNRKHVHEEITNHLDTLDALLNPTIFSENVNETINTVVIKVRNCLHISLVSG
jgi:hypothetical protein